MLKLQAVFVFVLNRSHIIGMKRFSKTICSIRVLAALVLGCAFLSVSSHGNAHFNLDLNIRTIHVVHTQQGLDVYLRIPTPYFLAELASGSLEEDNLVPAPFTYNRIEDNSVQHYLDITRIQSAPLEFAAIAAGGVRIETEGKLLKPEIVNVRLHSVYWQPPFASLNEARMALSDEPPDTVVKDSYVGETVTDLRLRYDYHQPVNSYQLSFSWNPELEGQETTANLLLDHFPGETRVFRFTGILNDPVEVKNSAIAAFATFTYQGIIHIIEGWDHLLFVICLALGAVTLTGLIWRVTGFTIGHTVTLIAGFWGYAPTYPWFIPTVELGIALSIIFVAVVAVGSAKKVSDSLHSFVITLLIGLLHGLGFSFVLHELLLPNGAHLWKSLLAFNVGVEIGQIMIVTVVWVILLLIGRFKRSLLTPARWAIVLPSVGIATYWAVERVQGLLATFA